MGKLNANVDALSPMYNISEIKDESYTIFIQKLETSIISNKNVKEVNGELIDSPSDYNIVSEIEKYYNFRSGINYEFIFILFIYLFEIHVRGHLVQIN